VVADQRAAVAGVVAAATAVAADITANQFFSHS
jgi:hypothetical protein